MALFPTKYSWRMCRADKEEISHVSDSSLSRSESSFYCQRSLNRRSAVFIIKTDWCQTSGRLLLSSPGSDSILMKAYQTISSSIRTNIRRFGGYICLSQEYVLIPMKASQSAASTRNIRRFGVYLCLNQQELLVSIKVFYSDQPCQWVITTKMVVHYNAVSKMTDFYLFSTGLISLEDLITFTGRENSDIVLWLLLYGSIFPRLCCLCR